MKEKTLNMFRPNTAIRWESCVGRGCMVLLACSLAGCQKPVVVTPEKALVRVTTVESMDRFRPNDELAYLAIVHAEKETDLSFKVGGIVEIVGAAPGADWDEGSPVKAGVVLARLKQADFDNAVDSARAQAELNTKVLERFRKLRATDAISQQELDVTEADWRSTQAQLEEAEQKQKDSALVASMDGVVLERYINSETTVGPGQRVLRFADTTTMSVELGLPDRLITRLAVGKTVEVEVPALGGHAPFQGHVSEVGVSANGDSRLFRVVIKVPNSDGLLRSGMTARIRLGETPVLAPGTVSVPLSALVALAANDQAGTNAPEQLTVFVLQDGKAVRRIVKTGDIVNSSILVTQGLQAGEQVVTSGASFLHDGEPVEVGSTSAPEE